MASSVLANDPQKTRFEAIKTLQLARRHNFDGAQLFLDPRFEKIEYVHRVFEILISIQLRYFLHLPNKPKSEILKALEILADLPLFKGAITHDVPAPVTNVTPIGFENSVNSEHDTTHIQSVFDHSRKVDRFFVYDFGRSFWAKLLVNRRLF